MSRVKNWHNKPSLSDTSVVKVTDCRCVWLLHHQAVFNFQTWTCQPRLDDHCWGWQVQKSFYCPYVKQLMTYLRQWWQFVCSVFVWVFLKRWWSGGQFHHLTIALLVGRCKSRVPGCWLPPLTRPALTRSVLNNRLPVASWRAPCCDKWVCVWQGSRVRLFWSHTRLKKKSVKDD